MDFTFFLVLDKDGVEEDLTPGLGLLDRAGGFVGWGQRLDPPAPVAVLPKSR